MHISPQRRRRILRAHDLRQRGLPLRRIAARLRVSAATVHADLRALETDWDALTHALYDDLLLQQIARLNRRLDRLLRHSPVEVARASLAPDAYLPVEHMIRLNDQHERNIVAAERELRMLLRQLRPDQRRRDAEPIDIQLADYPNDQLADPEPPDQHQTGLNKPEQANRLIPSNTQEIRANVLQKKFLREQRENPFPRNTGRNQSCPCNSGKKRKHCHPQSLAPPT